jgi:eukaryotic-like serine/threonine-protein kinase
MASSRRPKPPASPPQGTLIGVVLAGRYRLVQQVAHGGTSTVYQAHDAVLQRTVAIKLMHRQRARDSGQLERFRREARAMASLKHPQIVTVIEAGEAELAAEQRARDEPQHAPYIAFEYVGGETLKQRIRREGPLQIEQAIAYALDIAHGLEAAHDRGIVHRDIKPQNVLLSIGGGAKITDFGIARMLNERGLTMAGRVVGTTDYVSPEQALGRHVTGQSDIYSLGVVLYEMLTGTVPFRAPTPVAVAMSHVRETLPDLKALRPELSAASVSVVEGATDKDLTRRYRYAATMAGNLEGALASERARSPQSPGAPVQGRWRRRSPMRRVRWHLRHSTRSLGVVVMCLCVCATTLVTR